MEVLKSKSNVKSFGFYIIKYNNKIFLELKFGNRIWLIGF